MKNPKEYLSTLDVGREVTTTSLDKIIAALEAYGEDCWNAACEEIERDQNLSRDYIRPQFKPKEKDETPND